MDVVRTVITTLDPTSAAATTGIPWILLMKRLAKVHVRNHLKGA